MENKEVTTLSAFTPSTIDKIVKAWHGRKLRWKYGTIKPRYGGVGIYLKDRVLRNYIPSSVIANYLARRTK